MTQPGSQDHFVVDYSSSSQSSQNDSQSQVEPLPDSTLLLAACSWRKEEIEERTKELIEVAAAVLLNNQGVDPEVRLKVLGFTVEKLLPEMSVWELEDGAARPGFTCALDLLEQALRLVGDAEDNEGEALLNLATALLNHVTTLVRHIGLQEGCGMGEVSSLPGLLPSILSAAFRCVKVAMKRSPLKGVAGHTYGVAKNLLVQFLKVVVKMKVRTVLEDELEILVDLCKDLVRLHAIIIPLDFKLCLAIWKEYRFFVEKYQERLAERLQQGQAIEVLAAELVANLESQRNLGEGGEEGVKEMEKNVNKAGALMKLISNIAAAATKPALAVSKDCPKLLQLLLDLQGPPKVPSWLGDFHRQKLASEVTGLSPLHNLMAVVAAAEPFFAFLLGEGQHQVRKKPVAGLLLTTHLLLKLRGQYQQVSQGGETSKPGPSSSGSFSAGKAKSRNFRKDEKEPGEHIETSSRLASLALDLLTITPLNNGGLGSRQVAGKAATTTDIYTWFFTNICSWLAAANPHLTKSVEVILLDLLLSGHSVIGCQAASDIWVFLARFGSPSLCRTYIDLFTSLLQKLKPTSFTSPGSIFLPILLSRLLNLLDPLELDAWRQKQDLVDNWLVALVPAFEKDSPALNVQQVASTPTLISSIHSTCCSHSPTSQRADMLIDIWHRLASAAYKPGHTFVSAQAVQAVAKMTKAVLSKLSEQKVARLVFFMEKLVACRPANPNLNLAIAGILRLVLKQHPAMEAKSTSCKSLSKMLCEENGAPGSRMLTTPLMALVNLYTRAGQPLTTSQNSSLKNMSEVSREYGEDVIAKKISRHVNGDINIKDIPSIASSMEVESSDEGVSQPMEGLKMVDSEVRRTKRASPSSTSGSLAGKENKDPEDGSSPHNKKSRLSPEEEVKTRLSNLEKDIRELVPFLLQVSGPGSCETKQKAIGRLTAQLEEMKRRLRQS